VYALKRELLTDDRVARNKWPVLFWANRLTLIGAAAGLAATVVLFVYESAWPLAVSDRSTLDGIAGAAYVLTALLGMGFMATGFLRLFMVHRLPGHVPKPRPMRRQLGLMPRLAGAVVFLAAIATGWVHWGVGTAALFVGIFAVVYFAQRWR
jgi:uncharacterized membrane protein HdeD (DUF308 family)